MICCTLCLVIGGAQAPRAPVVAEFAAHYRARTSDWAGDKVDPEIKSALGLIVGFVAERVKQHPKADARDTDAWLTRFHSIVDGGRSGNRLPVETGSFEVTPYFINGNHLLVGRMGSLSRTIAFDTAGRPVQLPEEFEWNSNWLPIPKPLSNGFVLFEEVSMRSQGMRVPQHLVWVKFDAHRSTVAGSFLGATTLDFEETKVSGGRVTATTMDEPLALQSASASDPLFARSLTWDCSSGRLRMIRSETYQQALRAVDSAIFHAWHTKHPTLLQSKLRHKFPAGHSVELESWSETQGKDGAPMLILNRDCAFRLKRTKQGYEVLNLTW